MYLLNNKITTVCLPDKEFDYQATGHLYFGDYTFNGTASLCQCKNLWLLFTYSRRFML